MYLVIGKDKCPQCDTLLNMLDKKGIRNCYTDQTTMPANVISYLKMYSSTYPIVLEIKNQGSYADTLEYFANLGF